MTDPTALAILQDGSRIPLSDPLERAQTLFRDGQYDDEVVGIERSGEAERTQCSADSGAEPERATPAATTGTGMGPVPAGSQLAFAEFAQER